MTKTKSPSNAEPKPNGLNVKLLRRIQRAILKEPKRIDMDTWGGDTRYCNKQHLPPCGTVGCIAGWAVAINKRGKNRLAGETGLADQAIDLLGLTWDNWPKLFYPYSRWPEEWRCRLARESAGTPAYAQVVSDYIDYFIAEHEKETTSNDNDNTEAEAKR